MGALTFFPEVATSRQPHAHNGYLQLAAELGVPVALLASFHLLSMIGRAFFVYLTTYSASALFCFVYLVSFAIENVSEFRLYQPRRLEWVLAVAVMVTLLHARRPGGGDGRDERRVGARERLDLDGTPDRRGVEETS